MSEPASQENQIPPELSADDLIAVLRGDGSSELEARVLAAVKDPKSAVHGWLQGVESWVKRHLQLPIPLEPIATELPTAVDRLKRDESPSVSDIDAVVNLVLEQRGCDVLTEREAVQTLVAGIPVSSPQSLVAASRMIEVLLELHPELASKARQAMSRSR